MIRIDTTEAPAKAMRAICQSTKEEEPLALGGWVGVMRNLSSDSNCPEGLNISLLKRMTKTPASNYNYNT